MRSTLILFAALAVAAPASAATFKSEAHDHTVAIYSSTKTLEHCTVVQEFTFINEGAPTKTQIGCNVEVQPGNHRLACQVTNDIVIEPKLVGDVKVESCTSGPKPPAETRQRK